MVLFVFFLTASVAASPGDGGSIVTVDGKVRFKIGSNGNVAFSIAPAKGSSRTVVLGPSQVRKLKKSYDESLTLAKGKPDKKVSFKGLNTGERVVLTLTRYSAHRRRAFLFKIDRKRGGPVYFPVSKSKDELKRFTRFMNKLGEAAK